MHAAMTHAMTRAMPPARAAPARRATTTTTTARRVLSARSAVRARASAAIASPDARAKEAQAWIDAWKSGASAGAAGAAGAAAAATTTTFELRRGSRKVSDEKEAALLSTTSFGTIGLSVGLPLLLYGFCAYFSFLPGADISALMLIYGFPISLIGFAEVRRVGTVEARDVRGRFESAGGTNDADLDSSARGRDAIQIRR